LSTANPPDVVSALAFRNSTYNVSVALWDPNLQGLNGKSDTIAYFQQGQSGDSCPLNQVFDQGTLLCTFMNPAVPGTPVSNIYVGDAKLFFYFTVPAQARAVRVVNYVVNTSDTVWLTDGTTQLIFQLRRSGTPSLQNTDVVASPLVELQYPRPGNYVLLTRALTTGIGSFVVYIDMCPTSGNYSLGPNCSIPFIAQPTPNMQTRASSTVMTYFKFSVALRASVIINVRSFLGVNGSNPLIYASNGQLPTLGNNDLANCQIGYCSGVNTMLLQYTGTDPIGAQDWFVGVLAPPNMNGLMYGIWFTAGCAPNCEKHGVCVTEGAQINSCTCAPYYEGADCAYQSESNKRFIVLCFIAVFMLCVGIFGFGSSLIPRVSSCCSKVKEALPGCRCCPCLGKPTYDVL